MKDTWFVKIYRKLLENPISWNLELLWLVTALLLKANHRSNSFFLWTQKFTVNPWQFISSQVKLSVEFWMNRNKMIRLLKILEDEKIVNIKWYSKYSLFTMVNRGKYQTQWTSNDTASVTSNEQQVNTNKNDKNDKNDKKKLFELFRKLYPNKKGKAKAEEWYLKNITDELHSDIMFWVQAYIDDCESKRKKKEFVPEYKHWSTFLNQKSRQDYEAIKEDDAWQEAYSKDDAKIYANWCKKNFWEERSLLEYGVKYSELKKEIIEKKWEEVF